MQLHLFPTITQMIELEAKSPRKAFWRLMIEESLDQFWLIKQSGTGEIIRDRRRWGPYTMAKAVKIYERKVLDKLNPDRGSPRKYKIKRPGRRAAQVVGRKQNGVLK